MPTRVATVVFLAAGLVPLSLAAEPASQTSIIVKDAWLRATPKGAPVAAGYATITNTGSVPDHLIGAALPGTTKAEIHTMTMDHGVMHMSRLADGLELTPGASVTLKPGGYHLMFLNPTTVLQEKQMVAGSLTFEKAGTIPVTFAVAGMAAKSAPGHMDHNAIGGMGSKDTTMKDMNMKDMGMK